MAVRQSLTDEGVVLRRLSAESLSSFHLEEIRILSKMAAGGNVLWQIIWFLILIFIAFPVAGFCAGWYILILPFTVCIDGLTVSINTSVKIC